VYGFEHNVDGWKYVVVFLDGREPVDFTDLQQAEDFAEEDVMQ